MFFTWLAECYFPSVVLIPSVILINLHLSVRDYLFCIMLYWYKMCLFCTLITAYFPSFCIASYTFIYSLHAPLRHHLCKKSIHLLFGYANLSVGWLLKAGQVRICTCSTVSSLAVIKLSYLYKCPYLDAAWVWKLRCNDVAPIRKDQPLLS